MQKLYMRTPTDFQRYSGIEDGASERQKGKVQGPRQKTRNGKISLLWGEM